MNDYTQFRLPDNDDATWMLISIRKMGLEKFTEFEDKVLKALKKLKPGKYYDVSDIPEDRRELFIKLSCKYIQSHHEIYFATNYNRIYKDEQWILDFRSKELLERKRLEVNAQRNCGAHR